MNKTDEKPLLKPQEAACRLAISLRTLWQLTQDGEIPCVRIKRLVRYDPADITAYIGRQKINNN